MIEFHAEEVAMPELSRKDAQKWLTEILAEEQKSANEINIIFCSDDYLLEMNRTHLNHDYYTDIITFQYTDDPISGDLFISVDRVHENSISFDTEPIIELHRVMAHGVLHMIGYGDKSEEEQLIMRQKENYYLKKRARK